MKNNNLGKLIHLKKLCTDKNHFHRHTKLNGDCCERLSQLQNNHNQSSKNELIFE